MKRENGVVQSPLEITKALLGQGRESDAERYLAEVLIKTPEDFSALETLVALKTNFAKWDEAIALLKGRIEQLPPSAVVHHLLADILRSAGKMEEAELNYRRAIEIAPHESASYAGLARLRRYEQNDPLLEQIESQITQCSSVAEVDASFYFSAAKIYDDIGEYDKAFTFYQKANLLSKKKFSVSAFHKGVAALKDVFSEQFFSKRAHFGCSVKTPVFIVGMPRSGTTLVEQMMASHSEVAGVGERADIPAITGMLGKICGNALPYPYSASGLAAAQSSALGGKYAEKVVRHISDPAILRIVDKNPLNLMHVGLIRLLLPNAKIIHMKRHPLDTCLSCYFQDFGAGLDFTYSLESLAGFYTGYRDLMSHWHSIFPGMIIDVDYEQVTMEPQKQITRALDFCGLKWNDSCLGYVDSQQPIRTASVWQVRQPLYHSSMARWVKYEKHVQGLIGALADYV